MLGIFFIFLKGHWWSPCGMFGPEFDGSFQKRNGIGQNKGV